MAEDFEPIPVTKSSGKSKTPASEMVSDDASVSPTTPGPTACASSFSSFDFENDAFTFGEEENSFNQINVSKKEIVRK